MASYYKSDPNNLDHADVRIPPPLIYVAGFMLGLVLERFFPVALRKFQPSSGCFVHRARGNYSGVECQFISSGAHQFCSNQADAAASHLRPISFYPQSDAPRFGLLILGDSALVWYILGFDFASCCNGTHSTIRNHFTVAVTRRKVDEWTFSKGFHSTSHGQTDGLH